MIKKFYFSVKNIFFLSTSSTNCIVQPYRCNIIILLGVCAYAKALNVKLWLSFTSTFLRFTTILSLIPLALEIYLAFILSKSR